MRPGHADQLDTRHLHELLDREQPEPPATDHAQSDPLAVVAVVHSRTLLEFVKSMLLIKRLHPSRYLSEAHLIPNVRGVHGFPAGA